MTERALDAVSQPVLLGDVVNTMVTLDQTLSQLHALRSSLLATAYQIAEADPDIDDVRSREMAHRAIATELGAALRMSDRTVERQMGEAHALHTGFPATAEAFARGAVSAQHVRVIAESGERIETDARRAAFERLAIEKALTDSPNRLRSYAKGLAQRFRDASFQERHDEARRRRGVWVRDLEDGQSELGVSGPSAIIHGIFERVSQMGFAVKEQNGRAQKHAAPAPRAAQAPLLDARTLNEIRADVVADLLLTGVPSGHDTVDGLLGRIRGFVEVTVPVTTLLDPLGSAPPAQLEGIGPVDPETARILARQAPGWDRVMTDPVSGAMLAVDRYRPTQEMRRHLRARDRRCRFPGCRVTALKCDADHSIDHALGGVTGVENLAGQCRRHHMTKHHTGWTVRQCGGGVLEWTSPSGRRHVDEPPGTSAHVTFADVADRAAAARSPGERAPF